MPKIVLPEAPRRQIGPVSIDNERWEDLSKYLPNALSTEAEQRLRHKVLEQVSRFLTAQAAVHEGWATARALRSPGNRQPAPMERLVRSLRIAADTWRDMKSQSSLPWRPPFYDDRLSDLSRFDDLEEMANDAERRLAALRLHKPQTVPSAWRSFVRGVADCFRAEGMEPTATGRAYDEGGKLTWFQKFMQAMQENILGQDGFCSNSTQAFAAEVAAALRGERNAGKAQK